MAYVELSAPSRSGYKQVFDDLDAFDLARNKAAELLDVSVDAMVEIELGGITYCYGSQEAADEDRDGAYAVQYREVPRV